MEIKLCPFCGHPVDPTDEDTLYPTGYSWKQEAGGYRSYHMGVFNVPKEQWCYSIHCVTTSGGCGVEMNGDSAQECIDKWNKRV